jgi:S1-C subfamily serine protease
MSNVFSDLSQQLASAIERAATSVVQVHGHRRPTAGVVVGADLVIAPSRTLGDDTVVIRLPNGQTTEGAVLGHAFSMGIAALRVPTLGLPPLPVATEPKVGELAITVGRTWSGGVMATVTNIAVVGGPLRTGRTSQIDRVIRIAEEPHGALTGGALVDGDGRAFGILTGSAIRRTTIALPASLVWPAAEHIAKQGGTRQGFIGISSTTVQLPDRQRSGGTREHGLLVTAVAAKSPADAAGLLVGDIIVAFDAKTVHEPEELLTLLRGDRVGKPVTISLLRGVKLQDVTVTIGERPAPGR